MRNSVFSLFRSSIRTFNVHKRSYQVALVQQSRALASTSTLQWTSSFSENNESSDDLTTEYATYKRVTAKDVQHLSAPSVETKMLVRDFIDDSLYNPNYGYFSKQAVIFSPESDFKFNEIRDNTRFISLLADTYRNYEGDMDELDEISRQVWHTPTELFKPWYGYAIANYLVTEYKLNHFPQKDLIIYEMGAGNGTLMLNILDYICQREPQVYERTQYKIIEISSKLAQRQIARNELRRVERQHKGCVEVINKSIFEWDTIVQEDCFFLGMEVIDNFAHDLIRYDTVTLKPYQALVATDSFGDFSELYEPVSPHTDALIHRYLELRKSIPYNTPLLYYPFLLRLRNSLPFAPNLTAPEFIPTKLLLFLETLHDYFPNHRLVLSDFYALPDTIPGYFSPVVQTRYGGIMVPCSTYLVQPGWFDIFFPTHFELLRDIYQAVCRPIQAGVGGFFGGRRQSTWENGRVMTHREFLESYAETERTRTRSGENPMLSWFENVKFLLT